MKKRFLSALLILITIYPAGCGKPDSLASVPAAVSAPPVIIDQAPVIIPTDYLAFPTMGIYTPYDLERHLEKLQREYPEVIHLSEIGRSIQGRSIWAVKLGRGKKEIMINASHHAREWMTTYLVMRQLETYAMAYSLEENVGSYPVRKLLDRVSIWFVPMLNPDGVLLSQMGLAGTANQEILQSILKMNEYSWDISGWKANARGVDLNRQYNINWHKLEKTAGPAAMDYKGRQPESEPETQAMVRFTKKHNFLTTVSYHSSGSVIFWHYKHKNKKLITRDYALAQELSELTGYELVPPDPKQVVGGGYKDWFISTYQRPSFTVEIGRTVDRKPLKWEEFPAIWEENRELPLFLADRFK